MDSGHDGFRRRVRSAASHRMEPPVPTKDCGRLACRPIGSLRFTTTDGQLPSPLFGATFFTITGLHMFHVTTGMIYLGVIAARVKKANHEDIEISGLYWHFVDLVWMFVFPLIYMMSVDVGGHLAK